MTKTMTALEEVHVALNSAKMKEELKKALPDHVKLDRFLRVAWSAIRQNHKLLDVPRPSLFGACITAAQDGLIPDGEEAALVPYKDKVQYIPMVKGLLKKARNSGEISSIIVDAVYKNDEWTFWTDENGQHLKHVPNEEDPGEFRLVYCIVKTKDGGVYIEKMYKKDVEKVRACSKRKDTGPWKDWYGEMAKKSVIRRISKRIPMSTDLESFMETVRRDDEMYDLEKKQEKEPEKPKASDGPERLGKIIDAKSTTKKKEPEKAKKEEPEKKPADPNDALDAASSPI